VFVNSPTFLALRNISRGTFLNDWPQLY
jgi:hypothetical protein